MRKNGFIRHALVLLAGTGLLAILSATAATTIDAANKFAYGANIGWMNFTGDNTNGAVIGDYVCSGYIYSANVGWISLGSGLPTNGIRYQNASSNDFGVNHDGFGKLRGYAYGANIGWVNFENNGAPAVNLLTGRLSGSVYSANCGWISLSNSVAYVQTDSFSKGLLDANGLPIAWELTYFGATNLNANADPDGDGLSNYQEYMAGTNPTNSSDNLRITAATFAAGGTNSQFTWTSTLNRFYHLEKTLNLGTSSWLDSGLGLISPDGASTTRFFGDTNAPARFYRVRVSRPLAP
jgi:hypothetical protein